MTLIGNKKIGNGEPCFIIAEAGVNHNGNLRLAKKLIDAAFDAHADAVKFQTFSADDLVTSDAGKAGYQTVNDPSSATQLQMLKKLEFSETDFKKLSSYAKKRGIIFLSTPFDEKSLEILIRLNIPAYKIPSGEITNFPLLEKIAREKKPVILSTGMSSMDEVGVAVAFLRRLGCNDLVLLQCTTRYPAPPESVNLRVMDTLKEVFQIPVGFSDHTEGILAPVAAVARGACVIEKHFTLDRTLPGPDHAASLEPDELKRMISTIRDVERLLGKPEKVPDACELENRSIVRKSVVSSADIPSGTRLSGDMLILKRPGTGIEPKYFGKLIGKKTTTLIRKDTCITWEMVE